MRERDEIKRFGDRVKDHFGVHQAFNFGVLCCIGLGIFLGTAVMVVPAGALLVLSGVWAIRAERSEMTAFTYESRADSFDIQVTLELPLADDEHESPERRFQATLSGLLTILFGAAVTVGGVWILVH